MFKILLIILATAFIYTQFNYLLIDDKKNQSNTHIKLTKPINKIDQNTTTVTFFNPKYWVLTLIDKKEEIPKKTVIQETNDNNDTLQIIFQKGSRMLCKGNNCLSIKAILANILLLEKEKKIISIKKSDVLFDVIIFKGSKGTTMYFENNETNETYKLKFFSYKLKHDNNNTKEVKLKDKNGSSN